MKMYRSGLSLYFYIYKKQLASKWCTVTEDRDGRCNQGVNTVMKTMGFMSSSLIT